MIDHTLRFTRVRVVKGHMRRIYLVYFTVKSNIYIKTATFKSLEANDTLRVKVRQFR